MRKAVHGPGEFIITKTTGYHCGFNSGFNIAEAVNFALIPWLNNLASAHPCLCIRDSVRINYMDFKLNLFKNKEKLPFELPQNLLIEL